MLAAVHDRRRRVIASPGAAGAALGRGEHGAQNRKRDGGGLDGLQLVMMIDVEDLTDDDAIDVDRGDDRLSRPRSRQLDHQGVSDPRGRDQRRDRGSLAPLRVLAPSPLARAGGTHRRPTDRPWSTHHGAA